MESNKIKIIETVLRDANERVLNNRMTTEDMLPIIEKMDRIGFYAIDCWGGQIFEGAFQNFDDPWERLEAIRSRVKSTKLLMTMQGARIFSDQLYPDTMVESFVEICAQNGIDIFRLYDRDNNLDHLKTAIAVSKENHAEVQIALVYTKGDTPEMFVEKAVQAQNLGADVIILRDMEGILTPFLTADIFRALKNKVTVPLGIQMCQTTGLAEMSYMKAIENGCEIIDTTCSPFSTPVSNPATEVIFEVFEGTSHSAGLDRDVMQEVTDYFRKLSDDYQRSRIFTTDKLVLRLAQELPKPDADSEAMLYDSIDEEDIRTIRKEIALVEKNPMDVVTYALYPDRAKEYLERR